MHPSLNSFRRVGGRAGHDGHVLVPRVDRGCAAPKPHLLGAGVVLEFYLGLIVRFVLGHVVVNLEDVVVELLRVGWVVAVDTLCNFGMTTSWTRRSLSKAREQVKYK